jgi:hypothetical protein
MHTHTHTHTHTYQHTHTNTPTEPEKQQVWILKPPLAACGRHIQLVTDVSQVDPESDFILKKFPLAQEYGVPVLCPLS